MPKPNLMNKKMGRRVLLDITNTLRYCRIPFFLLNGTALGAYRDGGFVPQEKDIDIGILYENFQSKHSILTKELNRIGFICDLVSEPFDSVRSIHAFRDNIKVDIVTYVLWKDKRFCTNKNPKRNYAIVHERSLLETYENIIMFSHYFQIPCPIEKYLELEYGPDWKTPKDDSTSRTRVKDFVADKGLPRDYLQRFQTPTDSNKVGSSPW